MSITAANSVFSLSVAGLFPVPQQLHGYSADRAWETNNVQLTEAQIGVDGRKTAGFVYNLTEQTITLQGDSPSNSFFVAIINAMRAARDTYVLSGTIDLPATGESFILTHGTLKDAKTIPSAGKVLEARTYVVEWQSIAPILS